MEFLYEEFIERFGKEIKAVKKSNEEIICCPEPLYFYDCFKNMNGKEEINTLFNELIADRKGENTPKKYPQVPEFRRIQPTALEPAWKWSQSTENGIILRPGKTEKSIEEKMVSSVKLGDENVHGVIVGRTGSGKSVFINHLLMTLLQEYAPWELDLYLIDLKKVELGRYMPEGSYTPHICACAITEEIRYISSMLEHIYDCMRKRQLLFSKLGVKNLKSFRSTFSVILPRVLVVVDEFQQIYKSAAGEKNKDGERIEYLINSIVRLGRATGFHLLFASQDMQSALNDSELANFKARFALPCDSGVSQSILGSTVAHKSKEKVGVVFVNEKGGRTDEEEDTQKYTVPLIKDDDKFFWEAITTLKKQAENCGFGKKQSFYDEDAQEDMADFEKEILANEKVKIARAEKVEKQGYYDIITLGRGVTYSEKKYNIISFGIEKGKNKNILAVCNKTIDLAYVQKLLALNLKNVPNGKGVHKFYSFSPYIEYEIEEDLSQVEKFYKKEDFEIIKREYDERKKTDSKTEYEPWYIWIDGIEYIEKNPGYGESGFDRELLEIMENSIVYNMLFLLFSTSAESDYLTPEIKQCCDYVFVKDVKEGTYENLKMDGAKRSKNEIVIDFKIKSWNEERSFKKYKTQFRDENAVELDFDDILG